MTYQTIRHAQQAIWPRVRESVTIRKAARDATLANPEAATVAALSRARIPHNRMVADEAVWAIAKENLLASPEAAAVVKAAREWANDMGGEMVAFPEDFGAPDRKLYDAVQALCSSLEGLAETDDDGLTDRPAPRSVPLINN